MRRFRIFFVIAAVALLAPIGLLIERALHSVSVERQMRQQAVAERVFDEMERALSRLLEDEEKRPVDEYNHAIAGDAPAFVVGHFVIDANGAVRAIAAAAAVGGRTNEDVARTLSAYWRNEPGRAGRGAPPAQSPGTTLDLGKTAAAAQAPMQEAKKEAAKAKDVSAFDALRSLNKGALERSDRQRLATSEDDLRDEARESAGTRPPAAASAPLQAQVGGALRGAQELPPMVGRVIDAHQLILYRTVMSVAQVERQGLLIDVTQLVPWLRQQAIGDDGLEQYADVSFSTPYDTVPAGASTAALLFQHRFAEPFDGLTARLLLRPLPGVGSTSYVYALCALVLLSVLVGLAALYRMVAVVVAYAERRSNFVAAVSHELKTPLTAIRMYGEMLRDGMVASEAKRDEYYRHITAESERLSRLINNVLEFARLEKGAREVALTVGNVTPIVDELAEVVRPHLAAHSMTMHVTHEPGLPSVRYERDALMQVLWNLVDNAVKYGSNGTPSEIELRCAHDNGTVRIAVRDHGAGIAARHLGKIFEPFYRGENELTRRTKGTGLGLALVRGLVERMGGRVSGRNAPGGGFEVEIALPIVAQ